MSNDFVVRKRDRAGVGFDNQARVAFLLAGNDVINDHRTSRRDCFLNRRAAGFGDEDVIFTKQSRHFVGPAVNVDLAIACGTLNRAAKTFIATNGDS